MIKFAILSIGKMVTKPDYFLHVTNDGDILVFIYQISNPAVNLAFTEERPIKR